jgi:microcystin degradation protein MlrC
MPLRFVIALIKHETNTFSPIPTPLEKFGHGQGPAFGRAARDAFEGSATPMAAFIDIAKREGAEIITPVAAESWPSAACSRATFERLVRPLEDAVREAQRSGGCDAIFLDLHGAMVVDDNPDAEGEILTRLRRIHATVPIAVTFDYHTNLSSETVQCATVITGYKTYPHVDMYEAGQLAGEILVNAMKGRVKPVMKWGWLPIVPSIMRHAPEDGPAGAILDVARAAELRGDVLAATLLPAFAHADTPYTGVSVVVVGDAMKPNGEANAARVCDEMLRIARDNKAGFGYQRTVLAESVARAKVLGDAGPKAGDAGPVLLIDHCDNCGSGGTQDVMMVVEEILKQGLDDVAIAPIRDPDAVQKMIAAGIGNNVTLQLGGKADMPSIGLTGRPLAISGKVKTITDGEIVFRGPMYTGLKSHLGPTAVLEVSGTRGRTEIVVTSLHHEPFDLVIFRHCGIEPTKKRFIMLKSRIHYRAGFKPIARHIVECQGEGVTSADLSVYRYRHVKADLLLA